MTGNDMLRMSAPLIAMAGVWVAQRALTGGYRSFTGEAPPTADDLSEPVSKVIIFSVSAAVVAAAVNVAVTRQVAKSSQKARQNQVGVST